MSFLIDSTRYFGLSLAGCGTWLMLGASAARGAQLLDAPRADATVLHEYLSAHPETGKNGLKSNQSALTRGQVANLYNTLFVTGNGAAMGWVGAGSPTCDPGTTNDSFKTATLNRINFIRQISGLPAITFFNATDVVGQGAQSSALMQGVNPGLMHSPPATWTCYSAAGANAAGKSNLAKGLSGPTAINAYMDEAGSAGHRRWILFPPLAKSYSGDVSGTGVTQASDMWVIQNGNDGTWGPRPATPDGVAWPPGGFVPYQVLPKNSNAWSFSYPNANMSAANATVTKNGNPVAILGYEARDGAGYGDPAILFRPNNVASAGEFVSYANPGSVDQSYVVTVSGMTGTGVPASITYTVTVIDPAAPGMITINGKIGPAASITDALPRVQLCTSGGGVTCGVPSSTGAYSCTAPEGWSGSIHPQLAGYRIPAQVFTNVGANVTRDIGVRTAASFPSCNLDIDNNGLLDPAIDGVAIMRQLLGINQAALPALAGVCAQASSATHNFVASNSFNFNASGGTPALASSDGLMIVRAMRGMASASMNVLGKTGAANTNWAQVQSTLNATCGTNF